MRPESSRQWEGDTHSGSWQLCSVPRWPQWQTWWQCSWFADATGTRTYELVATWNEDTSPNGHPIERHGINVKQSIHSIHNTVVVAAIHHNIGTDYHDIERHGINVKQGIHSIHNTVVVAAVHHNIGTDYHDILPLLWLWSTYFL